MIQNPDILLSFINTKLRDQFDSIEALCDELDYSKEEIDGILNPAGYYYVKESNQYKAL